MDVSVILTLMQTILQVLESPICKNIGGIFKVKSELKRLQSTMSTIRDVLLDADYVQRQQFQLISNVERGWLEKLKEAVYEADDLFDRINTLANQKKLMEGNSVSKDLRLFFSEFSQLYSAFTTSREIKKMREMLNGIAKDHHDFGSREQVVCKASKMRETRETYSFVCEDVIIGRDNDKKEVIKMLQDTDTTVEENVAFVSIVGIGGLGKTALAQFVYNDKEIQSEFKLRMWVCVSDKFDPKDVLDKILALATNQTQGSLSLEQLQNKVRQELQGKKYLLVLDDVWNEDVIEWDKLRQPLIASCGRGSRVLVTTRSIKVAKVVRSCRIQELKGLSEKDSWSLFERIAFDQHQQRVDENSEQIGREIVSKCANVPLAIKVVASLLCGEGESKWRLVKNMGLADIQQDDGNGILSVLKLSYYHLPNALKNCFSYCAVFPKDYVIEKENLIYQWMAHGLIMPLDEDVGEDYFMTLLQRCFFQDVEKDEEGEIYSCKMHDLVHDIAREVAGSENLVEGSIASSSERTARHLAIRGNKIDGFSSCWTSIMSKVRTLSCTRLHHSSSLDTLFSNARCLRVLDLSNFGIKELPSTISNLIHLRYLDLSKNRELNVLPVSITKLCNLQTLNLRDCNKLQELPRDLSKLLNLRHLNIDSCHCLSHMPPRMNSLTCLRELTEFILCRESYASNLKQVGGIGQLEDLEHLNQLKGKLRIYVMGKNSLRNEAEKAKKGGYLMNKKYLKDLTISWDTRKPYKWEEYDDINENILLEDLQPHPNLEKFSLMSYRGVGFARQSWLNDFKSHLKNLTSLSIGFCVRLQHLPPLSPLPNLRSLDIWYCPNLEYVESSSSGSCEGRGKSRQSPFFPSLEKLKLQRLPKLKGWWSSSKYKYSFPCLSWVFINECPSLTSIPLCPSVQKLRMVKGYHRKVFVDIPLFEPFPHLYELEFSGYTTDRPEWKGEEIPWRALNQSLRSLNFDYDTHLVNLPEGMQHLTALHSLSLSLMTKLEALPEWIGCLSSLQSLRLSHCLELKSLPESIRSLASLTKLEIDKCSIILHKRCHNPDGEDWPKIQHIPHIHIQDWSSIFGGLIINPGKLS